MQALIIIDAQNEFSEKSKRPVPNFGEAIEGIKKRVQQARRENWPIAWVRHWRDIGIAYGPFDLAFMPINAARLTKGKVIDTGVGAVMNPEQAIVASKLLNAKRVCPIHYGRPSENYFETPDPEGNFLRSAKERKVETLLLKQGEWVKWS